jgi:hypothetical protein
MTRCERQTWVGRATLELGRSYNSHLFGSLLARPRLGSALGGSSPSEVACDVAKGGQPHRGTVRHKGGMRAGCVGGTRPCRAKALREDTIYGNTNPLGRGVLAAQL